MEELGPTSETVKLTNHKKKIGSMNPWDSTSQKLIYTRKFGPKISPKKKSNPRIEGVLFSSAPFVVVS